MSRYNYDAVLFVSFGGPEKRDDVIPFLENVLRGKNVPRERMLEVAEHYYHFDGVSPINRQTRELIDAVSNDLKGTGIEIPIYWGNRNWHPLLTDTIQQMTRDGVRRAIAFVTSAFSCYSGCRQYRENVSAACGPLGDEAPQVDKIRAFYNHPDFIAANADRLRDAMTQLSMSGRESFRVAFTAHSIPDSMASTSDYVKQLTETCRLIAEATDIPQDRWELVYQSRSGRPQDPWLEPDICDHLTVQHTAGIGAVVVVPIGFLCDHMEVMFDLDEEAARLCEQLGLEMSRAGTVGTHPRFVTAVRKLITERLITGTSQEAVGQFGPNWDICPEDCCPAPVRPQTPSQT